MTCYIESAEKAVISSYYEDIAEQYVLWNIECQLERELAEPHTDYYSEVIEQARNTVRENY